MNWNYIMMEIDQSKLKKKIHQKKPTLLTINKHI